MNKKIVYGYVWEIGTHKQINEDSLFFRTIKTKNGSLLIGCICDGMGGIGNGEIASGYAVEQLERWIFKELIPALRRSKSCDVIRGKGIRLFQKINRELFEHMKINRIPLGTTASLLILYEGKGYVFHIGDSRIYRLCSVPFLKKAVFIKSLTKDHKKDDSTLTRCMGLNPKGEPDFFQFSVSKRGCGFLLCSDGFYRHLEKEQLKCLSPKLLKDGRNIQKRLWEMGERMKKKGERDNLSALYIRV
ncbi:MAG: serine/threonine-protein phosphatase [Roseburia sp.]|nr:serine/threonine-protein phosphatase [Roseburia sp.]MCM1277439.1 serine/threonine-protein phosphatase [Robinsoniella sp.]